MGEYKYTYHCEAQAVTIDIMYIAMWSPDRGSDKMHLSVWSPIYDDTVNGSIAVGTF